MKELHFETINEHALDFYLGQGFKKLFERMSKDIKSGTFTLDGGDEEDKLNLDQAFYFLIKFCIPELLVADREEDVKVSNIDGFHNNSSISTIDHVFSSQHVGEFSFPRLSTIDLVDWTSLGEDFHTLLSTTKYTNNRIFEILLQSIGEISNQQIRVEGLTKELLLYALQYAKQCKTRVQGKESFFDASLRTLEKAGGGHVPYQEFLEVFKSKLVSTLNILAPGFNDAKQSTENLLNELRERGNNLMSFQCFAQAIKVYTEALLLAPPFS